MNNVSVYAYRMTSDTGYAPCVFEDNYHATNLLTLACCKGGQLRKNKNGGFTEVNTGLRHSIGKTFYNNLIGNDVYVIGILKNRVIWCAKITDIKTMVEYYSDSNAYGKRLDFIYSVRQCDCNAKTGKLERNARNQCFHGNKSGYKEDDLRFQHKRDELGKYVLLSNEFVYFGENSEEIKPSLLSKFPKKQETVVFNNYNDKDKEIIELIKSLFEKNNHYTPTEKLSEDNCSKKGCQAK